MPPQPFSWAAFGAAAWAGPTLWHWPSSPYSPTSITSWRWLRVYLHNVTSLCIVIVASLLVAGRPCYQAAAGALSFSWTDPPGMYDLAAERNASIAVVSGRYRRLGCVMTRSDRLPGWA